MITTREVVLFCALIATINVHAAKFEMTDEIWAQGSKTEVRLKVLKNIDTGEHAKIIISPGGRVEELFLNDKNGQLFDVLQGHSGNASGVWANLHWRGAMLAPFANRIANGSYEFNGHKHYMPRNEVWNNILLFTILQFVLSHFLT